METEPQWRNSYRITQRGALEKYLVPRFGSRHLGQLSKGELLGFRSDLCKLAGRLGATLSNRRVNAIMKPLRQILNEAAERYNFVSPFLHIKPLKTKRTEVIPFSLEEAQRILTSVRPDFRAYLTFRFFTGLRSGEVHGLKWKNADFERRLVLVRQSLVLGEDDDLKTDGSQRDVYTQRRKTCRVPCTSLPEPLACRHRELRKALPSFPRRALTSMTTCRSVAQASQRPATLVQVEVASAQAARQTRFLLGEMLRVFHPRALRTLKEDEMLERVEVEGGKLDDDPGRMVAGRNGEIRAVEVRARPHRQQ